jgi:hypothetical protein
MCPRLATKPAVSEHEPGLLPGSASLAAYRDPDRARARAAMTTLIDCLREGSPPR